MHDQAAPKMAQVRMRNLREVHRQPQRVLPAQVKLKPLGCFPVAYIFVAL
jgi:hypothetical protein